jgi:acyl-CoA thioester hydrolase
MPDTVLPHAHRVGYSECTVGNHIYYSRYLDLRERARGEFFCHLGKSLLEWQNDHTPFPMLECRLRYRATARYEDLLSIEVGVTMAHDARLNFTYRIGGPNGRLLVEAETQHACATVGEKPERLPRELIESLSPCLPAPAARL